MKVTTGPGDLAAAVKFAARALTARPAYPVLAGLKITASGGGTVQVSGSDSETSARAAINGEVGEPGTVLAPSQLLADITARLPRHPVTLTGQDSALTIEAGTTLYQLRLLPPDGYPVLPDLPAPAGHVTAGEFAPAVGQVVVAASRDDTLCQLGAVQITFTKDALTLAATDRYRAGIRHLPWHPATDLELPPTVLIPAPVMAEAARLTGTGPAGIHLATAGDRAPTTAGFSAGDQAITTCVIGGDYPDLAAIIPAGFSATATVDAGELAGAVKRLAVVAARESPVHLAFSPSQVELRASSGDEADGTDTLPCDLDGDPVTIAFHPRRLLDALTATSAERARIHLTTPTRPALITPADCEGQEETGVSYRHLLMPIRI